MPLQAPPRHSQDDLRVPQPQGMLFKGIYSGLRCYWARQAQTSRGFSHGNFTHTQNGSSSCEGLLCSCEGLCSHHNANIWMWSCLQKLRIKTIISNLDNLDAPAFQAFQGPYEALTELEIRLGPEWSATEAIRYGQTSMMQTASI